MSEQKEQVHSGQRRYEADKVHFNSGEPPRGVDDTRQNERQKAIAFEGTAHGSTLPSEEDVAVGAPGCQRCEVVPAPLQGPGTVHIRFAHTHTLGKALLFLEESQWKHSERDGTLSVHVGPGSLAPLLSPIMDLLCSAEQRDTRAVFQPEGQLMQAGDYFEIEALPEFVARSRSAWLLDILRDNRLYSHFQPIVARSNGHASNHTGNSHIANGHTIFAYECVMRAQVDGVTVFPGAMIDLARAAGLIFQLDLAARRSSVLGAAQHGIREKVFINFMPNSIYDPYSCLDSTVRLIDEVGLKREQVVFEVIESERLPEPRLLRRIVNYYRENGFGVALDDVGAGFSSLSTLADLKPDYVKLDMSLTRGVHQDKTKALVARKLLETVHELELKAVAEGIECEDEKHWVEEHGTDFLQGYLFARPGTPPPLI